MCMIQVFFYSITHRNKDIDIRCFTEIITFIITGGVSDGESYTVPAKSDRVWNAGKVSGRTHLLFNSSCVRIWQNLLERWRSSWLLHR